MCCFVFSSRRRHTRCALVTGVQTCALPISRSQALDVAKDNIRVNAVIPGWTWSAPIKKAHAENPEWVEQLAAQFHMSGRIGSAEELARAALFLCSSDASLITGSMLPVDGGRSEKRRVGKEGVSTGRIRGS